MYYYIYVTIFLCAEYECHKESKVAGLNCLRNQLTGDELLVWTIETFNMFYKKVSTYLMVQLEQYKWQILQTWYGKRILPMFYTLPLIYSYFSFIYDNYSDILLSYNYYKASYDGNHTTLEPNNSTCSYLLLSDGQVVVIAVAYLPKNFVQIFWTETTLEESINQSKI